MRKDIICTEFPRCNKYIYKAFKRLLLYIREGKSVEKWFFINKINRLQK